MACELHRVKMTTRYLVELLYVRKACSSGASYLPEVEAFTIQHVQPREKTCDDCIIRRVLAR